MAGSENRFERAQALSAAFDPIIELCLRLQINASELEQLLRVRFVERAAEWLKEQDPKAKTPSHEAVGLTTGLHRLEVQKIRGKGPRKSSQSRMKKKSEQHSQSQRVLELWRSGSRFQNSSGGPLGLPIEAYGSEPSFEELVKEALPHTRTGNVLDDLKRRGYVTVTDDVVRLRRVAPALPSELDTEALRQFAERLRQMGMTLIKTIENADGAAADPLALFASSESVRIPAEQIPRLRARLQDQIANFVQTFEQSAGLSVSKSKAKDPSLLVAASVYTASDRQT